MSHRHKHGQPNPKTPRTESHIRNKQVDKIQEWIPKEAQEIGARQGGGEERERKKGRRSKPKFRKTTQAEPIHPRTQKPTRSGESKGEISNLAQTPTRSQFGRATASSTCCLSSSSKPHPDPRFSWVERLLLVGTYLSEDCRHSKFSNPSVRTNLFLSPSSLPPLLRRT